MFGVFQTIFGALKEVLCFVWCIFKPSFVHYMGLYNVWRLSRLLRCIERAVFCLVSFKESLLKYIERALFCFACFKPSSAH